MKAWVYTVLVDGAWKAGFTLEWRIDARYWLGNCGKGEGRHRQEERLEYRKGHGAAGAESDSLSRKLRIQQESIPLGFAIYAAEHWSGGALEGHKLGKLLQEVEPQCLEWISSKALNIREMVQKYEGDGVGWNGEIRIFGNKVDGEGVSDEIFGMSQRIWDALLEDAEQFTTAVAGRALFAHELQELIHERAAPYWQLLVQLAKLTGKVQLTSGLAWRSSPRRGLAALLRPARELRCQRCGSGPAQHHRTACAACGNPGCAYCEACLTMGRSRMCALLLHGAAPLAAPGAAGTPAAGRAAAGRAQATEPQARWQLSPAQHAASRAALDFLQQPCAAAGGTPAACGGAGEAPSFLLWAVTGAGKTEMIFPLIAYAVERGQQVLIATPRRDVVLELQPRLQQAFPAQRIVTLYGGSDERWTAGDVTLSTTHQLMRFYRKFDLVIVDELDAFPYHNNDQLQFAAKKSCKADGKFIFLSATPPEMMQRAVRQGRLPHAKVPVRFHRHPLPAPQRLYSKPLRHYLERKVLPSQLLRELGNSIDRGAQLFVFITRIKQVEAFVALLRRNFPTLSIEGTSSEDPQRGEKVMQFRKQDIRLLVTTTILERGVTIPKSDVFILDADSALFDAASLVQMAGRAGRSKDDPNGRVFLCSPQLNRAQKQAIRQIRSMNRLAQRQGYFQRREDEAL